MWPGAGAGPGSGLISGNPGNLLSWQNLRLGLRPSLWPSLRPSLLNVVVVNIADVLLAGRVCGRVQMSGRVQVPGWVQVEMERQ